MIRENVKNNIIYLKVQYHYIVIWTLTMISLLNIYVKRIL